MRLIDIPNSAIRTLEIDTKKDVGVSTSRLSQSQALALPIIGRDMATRTSTKGVLYPVVFEHIVVS